MVFIQSNLILILIKRLSDVCPKNHVTFKLFNFNLNKQERDYDQIIVELQLKRLVRHMIWPLKRDLYIHPFGLKRCFHVAAKAQVFIPTSSLIFQIGSPHASECVLGLDSRKTNSQLASSDRQTHLHFTRSRQTERLINVCAFVMAVD